MTTADAIPSVTPAASDWTGPASRLQFIDGLRGLAMLMVLLFHCAANSDGWRSPLGVSGVVGYGYVGVNLFLVLSGFCLYWPFVQGSGRREPTLREFTAKRCRRILPPYYAALFFFWALLLLDVLTHHHFHEDATTPGHVVQSLAWHLVMLHNLRPEYALSINGVFWSLALESSLYLLFPLLVEAFRRGGPLVPTLAVLALDLGWRWAVSAYLPYGTAGEQFVLCNSLPGRCFEFAAGMVAAWALTRPAGLGRLAWMGCAVCLLGGMAGVWVTHRYGGFSASPDVLWGLCFAGLIVWAGQMGGLVHRVLSSPGLARLGIFSYSVYLVHLPLVKVLDHVALAYHLPPIPFGLAVIVPAALALGYAFHLRFEKPFLIPPRRVEPILAPSLVFAPAPSPAE